MEGKYAERSESLDVQYDIKSKFWRKYPIYLFYIYMHRSIEIVRYFDVNETEYERQCTQNALNVLNKINRLRLLL